MTYTTEYINGNYVTSTVGSTDPVPAAARGPRLPERDERREARRRRKASRKANYRKARGDSR